MSDTSVQQPSANATFQPVNTPLQQDNSQINQSGMIPSGFFSNFNSYLSGTNLYILISVVVLLVAYYLYSTNYFSKKNKTEILSEKEDQPILELEKDYYILDENKESFKLNLKEMIILHKQLLREAELQQQLQQQQLHHQQHHQQQMQQQQHQPQQPRQQQQPRQSGENF